MLAIGFVLFEAPNRDMPLVSTLQSTLFWDFPDQILGQIWDGCMLVLLDGCVLIVIELVRVYLLLWASFTTDYAGLTYAWCLVCCIAIESRRA